ncbi:hypothetical protein L6452_09659 [Arctium lappa]|uniref:Uncharacterized protein n=1 Tax=Arctium lappa TaxID=4217 RepID=A0ACB9DL51_ARCLA|nr:hypothetical protein L6452_09659 [Arctium lappa]
MRWVVVTITRKSGALDEPSRPVYPGTRYRRSRRPTTSSSIAGTSGASSSQSFTITTMATGNMSVFLSSHSYSSTTTTAAAAAGAAALGGSRSVPDRKLERPFFVGSTLEPYGKRPMKIQD